MSPIAKAILTLCPGLQCTEMIFKTSERSMNQHQEAKFAPLLCLNINERECYNGITAVAKMSS